MKKKKIGCMMALLLGMQIFLTGCDSLLIEFLDGDVSLEEIGGKIVEQQAGSENSIEMAKEVQSISEGKYAYESLDEVEKKVYDQMLETILSFEEKVILLTIDTEVMEKAYHALLCDYGGLFWFNGYVYTTYTRGGEVIGLEFSPEYIMEKEEKERTQAKVDEVVKEWLSGIGMHDSDYDKAKYVFETLIHKVDYVEGATDNQNILSVFLHNQTVCRGYACATQYLLERLGIPCLIVSGTANNESHAWNIVRLDGQYYHMDTTWGNSTYLGKTQSEKKFVNYNFLCMTDKEISNTHRVEMELPLPNCNSMRHNYYVKQGHYFNTWNPDEIGEVFRRAWENNEATVSVKCANQQLYEQLKEYFIDNQKISEFCVGLEYLYYIESPEFCVFTVNFKEM